MAAMVRTMSAVNRRPIGRNAARQLTQPATIIGRAAAPLLLPVLARVEFRSGDGLAGGPPLRLRAGSVERRDRDPVRRAGARAGAPEPHGGSLQRPHRRPP